jgi:hypothetical protein
MSTPRSRHRRPSRAQTRRLSLPPVEPPLLRTRFSAARLLRQFHQLLPVSLLASWLAQSDRCFYRRAFTPLITLWYCVFQRLSYRHTLSSVVEDARSGGADRLSPPGKKLSDQLTSEATPSFSDARQRLPLELFHKTLQHTAAQVGRAVQIARYCGLQAALLDGSTLRLRHHRDIPAEFPPHRTGNCKKEPYWCLARVVGIFCLATGTVLDTAMGGLQQSEQRLSFQLLQAAWQGWLIIADRNFGVYSVARAARAAQAQLLLRLTQARAAKLARLARIQLAHGLDTALTWSPSAHDQCPPDLLPEPLPGRLLALRIAHPGFRPFTLYLFTTLSAHLCSAQTLAQLYGQRWRVELYLRYVKTQMGLATSECYSAQMVRKEWLSGLIAYNLIRWTMAVAAARTRLPLPQLSFSRTRELLLGWLLRSNPRHSSLGSWQRLLTRVANARLPVRRQPRPAEPRAIRPFQKDVAKLFGSRAQARKQLAAANAES